MPPSGTRQTVYDPRVEEAKISGCQTGEVQNRQERRSSGSSMRKCFLKLLFLCRAVWVIFFVSISVKSIISHLFCGTVQNQVWLSDLERDSIYGQVPTSICLLDPQMLCLFRIQRYCSTWLVYGVYSVRGEDRPAFSAPGKRSAPSCFSVRRTFFSKEHELRKRSAKPPAMMTTLKQII